MAKPKKLTKQFKLMFAYGDRHAPHHDVDLERIILEIIDDLKPDIILDGGDMISADSLSSFQKSHSQMVGLQKELDLDYAWRETINTLVPNATKIVLKDNHFFRRLEDRMKEAIWMEDLRFLQAETLLRLDELKWQMVPEWKWKESLLFVHGDDKSINMTMASARNPVNKVRNMVRDYSLSVVRFHTHVTGIEMYRKQGIVSYAIQLGTFQDITKTKYLKHKDLVNWTNSASLFYLSDKCKEFHVVPILFNGKTAFVNGKYYS